MDKTIWTTPARLSKLLGINRSTIYRKLHAKREYNRLESRISEASGNLEIKVPEQYIEKYQEMFLNTH